MRNLKTLLLMAVPLALISSACEKAVEDPDACYELSVKKDIETIILTEPYTVDAGRTIDFENCGYADFYAFFSGRPGHVYSEFIDPADSTTTGGDTQAGGDFSFTYQEPGVFTATILLTNREVGNPGNYRQIPLDLVITVTEPEEGKK